MCKFLLIASLSFAVCALQAADRYVSPSGTAGNPGTLAAPWSAAHAVTAAQAGDVVYFRGGTYSVQLTIGVSGTATLPIVFREYPGETPVFDMTSVTPTGANGSIIRLINRSHVVIQGLTLQNWRTSSDSVVVVGIEITGSGSGVRLLGNTLHHIEQNNAVQGSFNANGHGIAVYGDSATPINNLTIDGNHLYSLRLGASEALVLNGNVTNFRVNNNVLHDCNNIGIDFIGYEGTSPDSAQDRARNGVCSGNTIYAIDSSFNPSYNGNFTTGGGDRSAAGIYVDGGSNIIIERNVVHSCNFGVELASEDGAGMADLITLRNNLLHHNQQAGLIMGGYSRTRGTTQNCLIVGNTLYQNGTIDASGGQIQCQFYVQNCTFKNNILWAPETATVVFNHAPAGGTAVQKEFGTTNVFTCNLYFSSAGTPTFEAYHSGGGQTYSTLAAWQASGLCAGDVDSTVGDPKFSEGLPNKSSPVTSYALSAQSPAVNTGQASPAFQPGSGERDLLGNARVRGGRVDRGACER